MAADVTRSIVIMISANTEWRALCEILVPAATQPTPYGAWFTHDIAVGEETVPLICFHGGWGKIAAAASTQYAIDRWQPDLLVNLGTCGGFAGSTTKGTIVLAERTLVYDIVEQMGSYTEAIAYYTTNLDIAWLGERYPHPVERALLVSGDRDLLSEDVVRLQSEFGAIAGDWESGAIAYVAAHNQTRCLILRGVSDLVSPAGGEAYGNMQAFVDGTQRIMAQLVTALPAWLSIAL